MKAKTTVNQFEKPFETLSSNVYDLMPPYSDLPIEFKRGNTKWNDATSTWFFKGVQKSQFTVKNGIDANTAFRHLGAIMGSWSPKHEHKESGVAYLMSLWFDDFKK